MYVLEHNISQSNSTLRSHHWQAYGFCGNGKLLEKICAAQPDSKHWRVVKAAGTCTDALRYCSAQAYGKAG